MELIHDTPDINLIIFLSAIIKRNVCENGKKYSGIKDVWEAIKIFESIVKFEIKEK